MNKTPLQHRRWLRFELAGKRPAFVNLRALHYLRYHSVDYGKPIYQRVQDKLDRKKNRFQRLHLQLWDNRRPTWVYRWRMPWERRS